MQNIKWWLFVLLTLLFSNFAVGDVVYDKWHHHGDTFLHDGDEYSITYYPSKEKVALFSETAENHIIGVGSCKSTESGRFCFSEIDDQNNIVRDGVLMPALKISIDVNTPKITVTRSFSQKSLNIGDKATITVTIKNQGLKSARVTYTDAYPGSFSVFSPTISIYNNEIVWSDNIPGNNERTLSYTLTVKDFDEFESKPSVTYAFDNFEKKVDVSQDIISVKAPVSIKSELSNDKVLAKEEVILTVSAENNINRPLDFSLFITLPLAMTVVKQPRHLKNSDNGFSFTGKLEPNEKKNFELILQSDNGGKFSIPVKTQYTYNGEKKSTDKNFSIDIRDSSLAPSLELSPKKVRAGDSFTLKFSLHNDDKSNDATDIKYFIDGDAITAIEGSIKNIAKGDRESILDKKFKAPLTSKEKEMNVKAHGLVMYSGKLYSFSTQASILITPLFLGVEISHDHDNTSYTPGSEIYIKTKLKNTANVPLNNVVMSDSYPSNIEFIGGKSSEVTSLTPQESKYVYKYKILVPFEYTYDSMNITSNIKIGNQELNYSTPIIISNSSPLVSIGEKNENSSIPLNISKIDSIEPGRGIFESILQWIRSLFG